jgi:hypothetical protein
MGFSFRCKVTRPDGSHAVNIDKRVSFGWKTVAAVVVVAAAVTAVVTNK